MLQVSSPFTVALQDYYGNQGLAEFSGTCQVLYNGTDLTLPTLGSSVNIYNGSSTFQLFSVQGMAAGCQFLGEWSKMPLRLATELPTRLWLLFLGDGLHLT